MLAEQIWIALALTGAINNFISDNLLDVFGIPETPECRACLIEGAIQCLHCFGIETSS